MSSYEGDSTSGRAGEPTGVDGKTSDHARLAGTKMYVVTVVEGTDQISGTLVVGRKPTVREARNLAATASIDSAAQAAHFEREGILPCAVRQVLAP